MSEKLFPSLIRRMFWLTGILEPWEARWLYGIAFLGLLVRVAAAWLQPAYIDEAAVYYTTKAGWNAVFEVARYEYSPPSFNAVMYPLIKVCSSVFILRLPEVFLFLPTFGAGYQLCRRMFPVWVSLMLCAFGAFSYNIWLTEAQFRYYGPLIFFLTWFWLGMEDALEQRIPFQNMLGRRSSFGWYLLALLAAGAASVHVLGLVVVCSCVLLVGRLAGTARIRMFLCIITGSLPMFIWLLWRQCSGGGISLAHSTMWNGDSWIMLASVPLCVLNCGVSQNILFYGRYNANLSQYHFAISCCYYCVNVFLWLLILSGYCRLRKRHKDMADMMGCSFFMTLLLLSVLGTVGIHELQPRYAVIFSLPIVCFLAEGFNQAKFVWVGFGAVISWTVLLTMAFPFTPSLWNQYWQSCIDYIETHQRAGDRIYIFTPYAGFSFAWAYDKEHISFDYGKSVYWIKQTVVSDKLPIVLLSNDVSYKPSDQELRNIAGQRVFLILNQTANTGGPPRWLFDHYRMVDHFGHRSIRYWADAEVILLEWVQ